MGEGVGWTVSSFAVLELTGSSRVPSSDSRGLVAKRLSSVYLPGKRSKG